MVRKRKNKKRLKKQTGGELNRPQGLINQGSGKIDPSSSERLPVDDVPAVLGRGEYVLNANAVGKVGTQFLDQLNNVGLNNGRKIQPGTLPSPSRYQRGGKVNRRNQMARKKLRRGGPVRKNRIRRQHGGMTHNGDCPPGTHWMPPSNGQEGYCMEGSTHPNGNGNGNGAMAGGYQRGGKIRKPVKRQYGGSMGGSSMNQCPPGQYMQNGMCVSSGGGYQRGGKISRRKPVKRQTGGYVFAGTNKPYTGRVINVGGKPYTTQGGGVEGNRKRLELQKGGSVRRSVRTPVKRQTGGRVRRVKRQRGGVVNRIKNGIRRKR